MLSGVRRRRTFAAGIALVQLLALHVAAPCSAQTGATVAVDCPQLGSEDAAQLEARARANILLRQQPGGLDVRIACSGGSARLRASRAERAVEREVLLGASDFRGAVLAALDDALAELERAEASTTAGAPKPADGVETSPETLAPAPAPPPRVPVAPPVAPKAFTQQERDAPPQPNAARSRHESVRLGADLLAESWGNDLAYGGRIGLRSSGPIGLGLVVGVETPLVDATGFSSTEFHATGQFSHEFASLGIEVAAGPGLSALYVAPNSGFEPSETRVMVAPFLELAVARPLWFGRFALVPGMGTRLFTETRRVTLEGADQLVIPVATLHLSLGLTYDLSSG